MKPKTDGGHPGRQLKLLKNYRNIKPTSALDESIEDSIRQLGGIITVESAAVIVEKSMTDYPPVSVRIKIETPGPDIKVEAKDYTGAAAFSKAWRELQKRAEWKKSRAGSRKRRAPRAVKPTQQKNRF